MENSKRVLSSVGQGAKGCKQSGGDSIGFESSIFLNTNNETQMKEINEGMENLKMSIEAETPDKTSRLSDANYKNCIPNELLARLDANSPIKNSQNCEIFKKHNTQDISLNDCKKNTILYDDEEVPKFTAKADTNTNTESKLNLDFGNTSKNYRLRSSIVSSNNDLLSQIKNENNSPVLKNKKDSQTVFNIKNSYSLGGRSSSNSINNFNNQLVENEMFFTSGSYAENKILNQTNNRSSNNDILNPFSPTFNNKRNRKDSSPLINYYDGTTEFLSQNLNNLIKAKNQPKMPVNYSEKPEENNCLYENEENYYTEFNNRNAVSSNEAFNYAYNNNQHQFTQMFNQNMNQYQNNQNNYNNINNDHKQLGIGKIDNNLNPQPQYSGTILSELRDSGKHSSNSITDFKENDNSSNNIFNQISNTMRRQNNNNSNNTINYNNNNNNFQFQQLNQMSQFSQYNQGSTCNNSMVNDDDESYIVEMFGKRGWVCEGCNNFNYESKLKFFKF